MFVSDTPFDESEKVIITVTKVKFVGEFDHWYSTLTYLGEKVFEKTASSYWEALDGVLEYLQESDSAIDHEWKEEDSNGKKRNREY